MGTNKMRALYTSYVQTCLVVMTTQGNSADFVKMVVGNMSYLGPKDLTQYFIRDSNMYMSQEGVVVVMVGTTGWTKKNVRLLQ